MLDGSTIREVRIAKGWTQNDLAEKVGTTQQTIEKIELGKIARTSYLPEIGMVLGLGEPSIELVLEIAATQWVELGQIPTGKQIIRALTAGGYKIVPLNGKVDAIDDPIAFINEIIERRGITSTELARVVGIAPSTLNKKLGDPESGGLNASTLKKIADWDRQR